MTLEVLLVPPLPCERWVSIERYVEAIARAAPEDVRVEVARAPECGGHALLQRYRERYRDYARALGEERRPAIVHIPDQALGHLVDAFPRTPAVVTCHDLMPLFMAEAGHPSRFKTWMDLTLLRRSLARMNAAARVIAISETTRRDLVRLLDWDPARITVAPNMLHPGYRVPVDSAPQPLGLPPRPRVLSVGRVAPYKNIEALILALGRPGLSGANLVRVGERLTDAQRALADRTGVLSRTTELGGLEPHELSKVYGACDVLVQPSLYEGFGVPVVEAMACGLPVVCSDGGALPEVAGEAALVVPLASGDLPHALAEAIERVVCEPETASTLRQRGLRHAESFRPAAVVPRLVEAYRTAIKEHGS